MVDGLRFTALNKPMATPRALQYCLTHSPIHTHIHTPTAVRVRRLAQGHLDTPLGGAGDQTSNLPGTSQYAAPGDTYQMTVPFSWRY